MNINELLKGVDCDCGRRHECDIEHVYIEKGAISRLTALTEKYGKVLIVADQNTYKAAGEKTLAALKNHETETVLFGKEILVPNEDAIETVEKALSAVTLIVGIGSGVIQDLCKYVSHYNKIPYMVVATAPSMDGYASDGAAMITGGMKVTYPATLPRALVADTEVLAAAPMDMLKAGYGDVLGKYSALNDWALSHLLNDEYFCDYIYNLTFEQISRTVNLADGILKRDEESIEALMEALIVIGILMSFAGSSRPASGSEHHLSHFFEITGILAGRDYFPHGIDVAYSTVVTAAIRERLLELSDFEHFSRPSENETVAEINRIYGPIAESCISLHKKTGNYEKDRTADYKEKADEIRKILEKMPSAKEIERLLSLVSLNTREFWEFYGENIVRDAVLYAKDLKDRYTVLWMNYDFFGSEK